MQIDTFDKQLIQMLAKNGRITSAEIARSLGVHERTVAKRVQKLLEKGLVEVVGLVNKNAFGYDIIGEIICSSKGADLRSLAEEIAKFPEVSYASLILGEQGLSIGVHSKSTSDLHEFVAKKLSRVEGLEIEKLTIIAEIIKDVHEWLPEEVADD